MDKKQEVFDKVKEMVVQELNVKPENVNLEAGLSEDFGADSLDALELFNQIESEFLITIDDESATDIKTVNDLVNYVFSNVSDSYFK